MKSKDGCYEFRRGCPGEYYCAALTLYAVRYGRNSWSLEFPFLTNRYFRMPKQCCITTTIAGFATLKEALAFPIYDNMISTSCEPEDGWIRYDQAFPKAIFE